LDRAGYLRRFELTTPAVQNESYETERAPGVDVQTIIDNVAAGSRFQELTLGQSAQGSNRVFRLFTDDGTRILKIYGSPAHQRREFHALQALGGLEGMPNLLDRRDDPESAWALFADSGKWNLGSLPENEGLAQRAGEILRSVHESGAEVSNLTRGIDADWVATDFTSALRRLQRYRGKLRLPGDLFVRARSVAPPPATEPKVSHAHLSAERVVVDDGGAVTLIGWEWVIGTRVGERAAIAFQEGYGRTLVQTELERWTVYHTAMLLLFRADDSLRSGSGADLDYLISELHRSVAAAAS
jgi:hypothetical protein